MNLKIIGSGFGRTGTYSLKLALEQLLTPTQLTMIQMAMWIILLCIFVRIWYCVGNIFLPQNFSWCGHYAKQVMKIIEIIYCGVWIMKF